MVAPLFGLETEYAYTANLNTGAEGKVNRDDGEVFLCTAKARLAHLPGTRSDLFLANGSRLYVDCGLQGFHWQSSERVLHRFKTSRSSPDYYRY